MARFETTGQVVGLFLGAAAVAVLCIVFLTAEAHKREMVEEEEEERVEEEGVVGGFQGVIQSLTNFFGGKQEEMDVKRYKRDIGDEQEKTLKRYKRDIGDEQEKITLKRYKRNTGDDMLDDFVFGDKNEFKIMEEKEEQNKDVTIPEKLSSLEKEKKHEDKNVSPDIDEALLSEASSQHKIRHIHEKISHLSPDHQLVVAVLDKFCVISPCPSIKCPVCPKINSTQCPDNTNIEKLTSTNDNSKNTTSDENNNTSINSNNNNRTSGCPVISCPTGHMKHQFPHTYTHEHPQLGQKTIPATPIVCSTNTEVIVIILLTSFTNFIIYTILFFCLKAKENFREELMAEEEEDNENDETNEEENGGQVFDAKRLKSIQRRYSFSDIGYTHSPKYTVLEEYGFVV